MARSVKAMLAGAVFLVLGTGTAHAQLDDATIAVRECRKLTDGAARIACYDNIPVGQQADGPALPQASIVQASPDFGSKQLPRPAAAPAEPRELTARLSAVAQRRPGVWLLTLEDGAQWEFIDSVPPSYAPPRRGDTVELIGAALGSYLLRYDGQRSVRIRRVR
jgi:hypothetical protein